MSAKHKTHGCVPQHYKSIEQKLKPWGYICTIVFFTYYFNVVLHGNCYVVLGIKYRICFMIT